MVSFLKLRLQRRWVRITRATEGYVEDHVHQRAGVSYAHTLPPVLEEAVYQAYIGVDPPMIDAHNVMFVPPRATGVDD